MTIIIQIGVEMRGKRLKLALSLKAFSESESPNLRQALLNTAEAFVDLEEYRKYMVCFFFFLLNVEILK